MSRARVAMRLLSLVAFVVAVSSCSKEPAGSRESSVAADSEGSEIVEDAGRIRLTPAMMAEYVEVLPRLRGLSKDAERAKRLEGSLLDPRTYRYIDGLVDDLESREDERRAEEVAERDAVRSEVTRRVTRELPGRIADSLESYPEPMLEGMQKTVQLLKSLSRDEEHNEKLKKLERDFETKVAEKQRDFQEAGQRVRGEGRVLADGMAADSEPSKKEGPSVQGHASDLFISDLDIENRKIVREWLPRIRAAKNRVRQP